MNSTEQTSEHSGYTCALCARFHPYTMYVHAHRFEHLRTRCECGAVYDIYDREATLIDRLAKPAVTDWITGEPAHIGYYHIRFPNGTEADRNWYWDGATFRYDKDSPVSLASNCIQAFRGLTRRFD